MANVNPKKLPGRWIDGYALDLHTVYSVPIGEDEYGHQRFDTPRTELGELLDRLKYSGDQTALGELVETAATFVGGWAEARGIEMLVPVPPSKQRAVQPALQVATALAAKLGIAYEPQAITKLKETPELKNVSDYDERLRLLAGAHSVDATRVAGKSILLFDDLYRSGATMNSIAALLLDTGKAAKVIALTLTRTRSKQ